MTESEINKEAAKFFPPQRYPFGLAFSQDDVVAFAQHCMDKATAWRPIADAPKDGAWIIALDSNGNVRPDYWLFRQEQWAKEPHSAVNTHWQPLPPPPPPEAA